MELQKLLNKMFQKKIFLVLLYVFIALLSSAPDVNVITKSMGNIKLSFLLDEKGSLQYAVTYKQKAVINSSQLGFVLENKTSFNSGFIILSTERKMVDETPLMMKTSDSLYINIHEAALVNYPAMQLHVNRNTFSLSANLVPDAYGNKAYLRTPSHTPWRTIIVSDKATDILDSKMILNLNEPAKIENTSWIQPMKFIGIGWEMQTGIGSWSYSDNLDSLSSSGVLIPHNHHSANTANVNRYIDFASKHGIKGLLVEGWNTAGKNGMAIGTERILTL